MPQRIIRAFWGDMRGEELKKFLLLSLGFFFLLGSYAPLKVLKNIVFINTVGSLYQPDVKSLSLLLFFPLVLLYSKLVDYFSKEKLLYLVVGTYAIIGFILVYFLYHPTIGLANTTQSKYRILGWVFYVFVESYISLILSLYWAFIHDVTTPESARKGYGLLIFGCQSGSLAFIVLGKYLTRDVHLYATQTPFVALISVMMFFVVAIVVFALTHWVNKKELMGYQDKHEAYVVSEDGEAEKSVGFLEGLKVLIGCPYVGGIFGMVFFHEVISTLMDYQMLRTVELTYNPGDGSIINQGMVGQFNFDFGLIMQGVSCVFALFGTAYFQRKIGVGGCLIAYPLVLGVSICAYMLNPTLGVITGVMVVAKGINYVLNQPAKEMLYIPTTKAVKYKSKAWIDMFGMRSAKFAGAQVNKVVGLAARFSGFASIGIIAIWVVLAKYIGARYQDVITHGKRIG